MKSERTLRIIIADAQPVFCNGLINIFNNESDIEIVGEADNGEKAYEIIVEIKPEIVLLNIHLPKMSGMQVLKKLKKNKINVKAIFLSDDNDESLFDESMETGVSGYLLKDSSTADFIESIRKVASGDYFICPSVSNLIINRRDKIKKFESNIPSILLLSKTELNVLKLVSEGKTSVEIGTELFISPKTVDNHRTNINSKLNLKGTHSLIKFAFENKSLL